MKSKKVLALLLTGIMTIGTCMVVSAAPSDGTSVSGNAITVQEESAEEQAAREEKARETARQEVISRESEAMVRAILATGIPQETWFAAEAEGKSMGEYTSNSIMEVPGLDDVTPVAQGGGIIIDGQETNATFSVQKPLRAHVDSAKSQAAALGGKVLNVVGLRTTATFGTATANFYMPGVATGENVQVYQYVDNQWVSVNVTEVRDDHVVVDLTSTGVFAFIEVQ